MGAWIVDEVEIEGPERVMVIRARSANTPSATGGNSGVISQLQGNANATYEGLTILGIVSQIAARNNLKTAVDPEVGKIPIPHIAQSNEPDSFFLYNPSRSIQRRHEGPGKVDHRVSAWLWGGAARQWLCSDDLDHPHNPQDCLRWRATLTRRSAHKKAKAFYYDKGKGQNVYVRRGCTRRHRRGF